MYSPASSLDTLELLEAITEHLELNEIRKMRLVCKPWDVKVISNISVLIHLHVELDDVTLLQLLETVSSPAKAATIKALTFTAHFYDLSATQEILALPRRRRGEATDSLGLVVGSANIWEEDIKRMEESYSSMSRQSAFFITQKAEDMLTSVLSSTLNLRCIELYTSSHTYEHWQAERHPNTDSIYSCKVPWMAGAGLLHVLFKSLRRVNIAALRKLSIRGVIPKCSIPRPALASVIPLIKQDAHIRDILSKLETFALCMTLDKEEAVHATEYKLWRHADWLEWLLRQTEKRYQLASISKMLSYMPRLKELDLHFYTSGGQGTTSEATFTYILDGIKLNRLKKCTLRGVRCTEQLMARFIGAHSNLEELHLKCVQVKDWQAILMQIATMPRLYHVRFEWLHEGLNKVLNLTRRYEREVSPQSPEFSGDPNEYWGQLPVVFRYSRTFSDPGLEFHFKDTPIGLWSRNLYVHRRTLLVEEYGEAWRGSQSLSGVLAQRDHGI